MTADGIGSCFLSTRAARTGAANDKSKRGLEAAKFVLVTNCKSSLIEFAAMATK